MLAPCFPIAHAMCDEDNSSPPPSLWPNEVSLILKFTFSMTLTYAITTWQVEGMIIHKTTDNSLIFKILFIFLQNTVDCHGVISLLANSMEL